MRQPVLGAALRDREANQPDRKPDVTSGRWPSPTVSPLRSSASASRRTFLRLWKITLRPERSQPCSEGQFPFVMAHQLCECKETEQRSLTLARLGHSSGRAACFLEAGKGEPSAATIGRSTVVFG